MADLVGTCPKGEWVKWLAEGDAAGEPETGQEYGWWTRHFLIRRISPGDRFYVVAHGRLRGYSIVTRVHLSQDGKGGAICRMGGGVACTLPDRVPGFRGLKVRWWDRSDEVDFPDWRKPTAGPEPRYAVCIQCGRTMSWFEHQQLRTSVDCPRCHTKDQFGPGVYVDNFHGYRDDGGEGASMTSHNFGDTDGTRHIA